MTDTGCFFFSETTSLQERKTKSTQIMCVRYTSVPSLFVLLVLSLFNFTASSPILRISPTVINVGLNKTLDVECTYRQGSLPSFKSLFSLVLTHFRKSKNSTLTHLVSVSSSMGLVNGTQLKTPFTTSGSINNENISHVKISWEFPSKNRAGLYKCEAHGHDQTGRPVSASSSDSLKAKSPSLDLVLSEIRGLKDYIDNLHTAFSSSENNLSRQIRQVSSHVDKLQAHVSNSENRQSSEISSVSNTVSSLQSRLANLDGRASHIENFHNNVKNSMDMSKQAMSNIESSLSSQIRAISSTINQLQNQHSKSENQLRSEISSVSSSVSNLQSRVANLEIQTSALRTHQDKVKKNMETSKQAMFISSSHYQGRRYWLTRSSSFFNPSYSQSTCMMYGGYLAEVNDIYEIQFIQSWVRSYGRQYYAVMLGGTDEGHEGTWIHMYSRTSVPSLWYRGQPDNYDGKEHCLCLWRKFDYAMNDAPCHVTNSNDVGFVCEIPE